MTWTFGPQPAPVPPPPGLASSPPAPRQGQYIGEATVGFAPGGAPGCQNLHIENFSISGNQVTFGRFYGPILRNGSVSMEAGDAFVNGQFYGAHFHGQYWVPGGCSWNLSLDPAGA